jgi:hypothetical protein
MIRRLEVLGSGQRPDQSLWVVDEDRKVLGANPKVGAAVLQVHQRCLVVLALASQTGPRGYGHVQSWFR